MIIIASFVDSCLKPFEHWATLQLSSSYGSKQCFIWKHL